VKSLSRRGKILLVLTLAVILALGLAVAGLCWQYYALWGPHAAEFLASAKEMLHKMDPVVYFLVMAVLPVVPVPTLPFYLGVMWLSRYLRIDPLAEHREGETP